MTSDKPFVAGLEIGADATGVHAFEPLYARLVNGPFAALDDPRATLLFALVDYPEPPTGLSPTQAALFRMECVQAALRISVVGGIEVQMTGKGSWQGTIFHFYISPRCRPCGAASAQSS